MKPTRPEFTFPHTFTKDDVLEHAFTDWSNRQVINDMTAGKNPHDLLTITVPLRFTISAQEAKAKLKDVLERERKGEDR